MSSSPSMRAGALLAIILGMCCVSGLAQAEGSRNLYPASYPSGGTASGARANLDLQPPQYYVNRVLRRGFIYVYAQQGEYILLGSSNIGTDAGYGGDVRVYNPQDFGIRGDETLPAIGEFQLYRRHCRRRQPFFRGKSSGAFARGQRNWPAPTVQTAPPR